MILRAVDLEKRFPVRGSSAFVQAVSGVSFDLAAGETLGIVGESGSGKSTLARLLVCLERPSTGRVELDGVDLNSLSPRALRRQRRRIQMVLQDPYASLNPRRTASETVREVLQVHELSAASDREGRVTELLRLVGLTSRLGERYPHELSGGQRQRVGIARALAVGPSVLVLDEPVSALDVSVRAEVMNLLIRLRTELALSYVFISHDLSMVRQISDRIAVMYLGRIVELGGWRQVLEQPLHPYAAALRDAVPVPDPELASDLGRVISGELPNPASPPSGCPFHPRCPLVEEICTQVRPELVELLPQQQAACHVAARAVRRA